jgi:hypothetical protein
LSVHARSIRLGDTDTAVRPEGGGGGGSVAGATVFEYAEWLGPSKARTRYRYVVPATSEVFAKLVTFAPSCAICVKVTPSAERSTLNPCS